MLIPDVPYLLDRYERTEAAVATLGRLGRSQGCPALSPAAAARVIELIRGGTVLFAYYPSPPL